MHNDEGAYSGSNTLTGATAFSDNSIYAEVGLKVGTQKIALLAHRMGITTPLSTNPAMTIGGLTVGVTPLDMAHAYETIAHGGERVTGSLAEGGAPVGIQEVEAGSQPLPDGSRRRHATRSAPSACCRRRSPQTETSMLETVLQYGTGKAAAIGQFAAGKTGTTSNYGDAWFVGWDSKYTVAVWVGYPNKLIPMTTDFNGTPVLGGTFPALIWHDFMTSALQIDKARAEHAAAKHGVHRRHAAKPPRARAAPKRPQRRPRRAPARARSPARPGRRQRRQLRPWRRRRQRSAPAKPDAGRTRRRAAPHRRTAPRQPKRPSTPPASTPPAPSTPLADGRRRRAPDAGGHGRETLRLPATQKRQGSSTARLIPMRVPGLRSAGPRHFAAREPIAHRPARQARCRSRSSVDAQRLRELARPRAQLLARAPCSRQRRGARASPRCP